MKKKIGTPPPKKAPGARKTAPRTRKKPFCLKVGKTYETEDSSIAVLILEIGGNVATGRFIRSDVPSWTGTRDEWLLNGCWRDSRRPGDLSLIREVPSAKRPGAPKGRRAPK